MWWGHDFQPIWNCQAVRMRYNVAIKRGGMMIMHFDSRLPRQERPSQKKEEREREREGESRSYVTSLPSFSAGQWKIHLHCSTSQFAHFNTASFTGWGEPGEYYQQTDKNISLFIYILWFNVQLFWYFKTHSNSACSIIINHETEPLWCAWSKLVHQLKLNNSF